MIKLRIDINAGKVSETEGHNIMILTLSHELTHYAENFAHKEYADLQEFVFDALSKSTGKDIKELIAEEMEHQRRQNREHGTNIEVTESRAKSELVARGCELVLTDAETIRELAERNRGLFGKIKAKIIEFTDSIINACKEILGKDGNIKNDVISKEAMQMKEYAEKLRTLWNEAVGAAGVSNAVKSEKNSVSGGVREMIRYDSDNTPFVEIDKDIFKGVTNKKERIKLVKEAIRDSFSTGIEIDEGNVWSSGKTRKEFTDSKYSNWLKRKHKIIYTRKLRMAGNADEIVKSVKKYSYETPLHPRKDNLIGFYRGDTKIRIGKFDYTADVILALDSSNKMYFYDIINIENTKIEEPTEPGSQMNENNKRLVNSSINSISRNSENDNSIIKLRIDINAGKISETEGHNIMILTLSHELTHYAENFAHKEYADLQEFVFDALSKSTGKDIKELIAEEMEHQRRQNREHGTNIEVTESRAKSELVARGCELVLTDAETIRELAERNRGLFGKIKAKIIEFTDSIINACKEILGKDGNIKNDVISKEAMQMKEYAEKLRTLWNEAVGAAGVSNAVKSEKNSVSGGVREMIRYDSDNTPFVEIDSNILDGISEEQWNKKVKEVLKKKFSNGIKVGNNTIFMDAKGRNEFVFSRYTQKI